MAMSKLSLLMRTQQIPGLNLAWVSTNGGIHRKALGMSETESAQPLQPEHRMQAGSVGKTFTAATLLAQLNRHQIPLDTPIATWFANESWYKNWAPDADGISPRMLLNHSAGIPDHRIASSFVSALTQKLRQSPPDYSLYFSPDELIGFVQDKPLDFAPGSQYRYSETGYILCGLLIEKLAKEPYYRLVQDLFIEPLGLTDTTPALWRNEEGNEDTLAQGPLAQGHIGPNEVSLPKFTLKNDKLILNPATEWTGGGFISTAADLARWGRVLYRGEALDFPYLQTMIESDFQKGKFKSNYGLGCYLWPSRFGTLYGHSGEAPGYRSIMAYSPKLDISIALQINTSVPEHSILNTLLEISLDTLFGGKRSGK